MSNQEVKEYKYSNGKYSFSILNLGLAITSICVPDRDGVVRNITVPFKNPVKNPDEIFSTKANFGLTVGRFANRIKNSCFELNGKKYSFEPNEGANLLHSGKNSLRFRFWDVRHESDGFSCHIVTTHEQDGFPGDLEVWIRFSMTNDGVFSIHYKACPTEDCPVNLTNHVYFNLTGNPENLIGSHEIAFDGCRVVENDDEHIPTGRILEIPRPATIGEIIDNKDSCNLIDRPFGQARGFTHYCKVHEPEHGIVMNCYTDLPAVHFYIASNESFSGFCLETEFVPDCVNQPCFDSCIVKAGELFESTTTYAFSTDKPAGLFV